MGKKSSKTTTGPSKQALPYIKSATDAVTGAYNSNAGNIANITSTLQNNLPTVLGQTLNNPTLGAANSYDQDVLSGKYLTGNPYLDAQIKATNEDVTNTVNGAIGTRGLTGGSAQAAILAKQLANNETNLRYTDYTNERNNMNTAAGNAASLSGANDNNIQALLAYLTGQAGIPASAADDYANNIAKLWGGSQTTTQSQSLGSTLGGLVGAGLAGWASGGFKGV